MFNKNETVVLMRTIDEAYQALVKLDPDTAVTKYRIKMLVKSGVIPTIPAGNKKVYINFNTLIDYLTNPEKYPVPEK